MRSFTHAWLVVTLLMGLSGCASVSGRVRGGPAQPTTADNLTWWLSRHPLATAENIRIDEVERTETSSSHLVQIRDREPLHVHHQHDLEAMLHRGHGTFHIGSKQVELRAGGLITIPRGTPHAFINHAIEPAVAFAVFTPPFDGQDTIEVKEGSVPSP